MSINKITPQIAAMYLGQNCIMEFLCDDRIRQDFVKGETWHSSIISARHVSRIEDDIITIIPHLRRLPSITEEEAKHLFTLESDTEFSKSIYNEDYTNFGLGFSNEKEWALSQFIHPLYFNPSQFIYLLSLGFDLFNLIDAGLAKEIEV